MSAENETKKVRLQLASLQSDLERLQHLIDSTQLPHRDALLRHMAGENGLLRPLGELLNQLLDDPVVRAALESVVPVEPQTQH